MPTPNRDRADKDAFSLSETVEPGTSGETTATMPADGTVEYLQVRIYIGAELDLRLTPVIRPDTGTERELVKLAGKPYIDGDDDVYTFDPAKPIQDNEEIVIKYENVGDNPLDFRVNADVDYAGGLERLLNVVGL